MPGETSFSGTSTTFSPRHLQPRLSPQTSLCFCDQYNHLQDVDYSSRVVFRSLRHHNSISESRSSHMPASVLTAHVPLVKMDERKRSGEELAPPSKRQAVNGKTASADADMPWSADLEVRCCRLAALHPSHHADLLPVLSIINLSIRSVGRSSCLTYCACCACLIASSTQRSSSPLLSTYSTVRTTTPARILF